MFRTLGKSKIAFVLAILFGISLFFFKGGSRYSNIFNSDTVIASVSGTPISNTKFNRTLRMNINNFNQMIGKELSIDEIKAYQLHLLSVRALINDAVFENEYDKINLKIDETIIAKKTKERIPQLYDKNNQLNEVYLNSFLKQQQLKIEDIVQIINFETRDEYINNAFFKIDYPQYFTNKIYNYNNHERDISFFELPIEDVNIDEIIKEYSSDKKIELKKFYDENINQYMSEEKRNIKYLVINREDFISLFTPTKSEIEEYYNSNKNLFYENEKRNFIQFNFKSIVEAEDFKNKIKYFNTKETLEYANKNNIRYNEFKELNKNEMLEEISLSLFNLEINEQSNIIETSIAKHIIILQDIILAKQLILQEVENNIKNTINSIETNNYFIEINNQISEEIIKGKTIEEISKNYNIKIKTINDVTQDYNNYNSNQKAFFTNLISSAFTSNKDFVSDVISVNDELSFIFNVTEIKLSAPLDFQLITDNIFEDWKINKNNEKIKIDTSENKNNKNYLTQLSKRYNIPTQQLSITKNTNKLPGNLVNKIFESKKGQTLQIIYKDKIYLAQINKILITDSKDVQSTISLTEDLRSSFGSELIKDKKISTNDNLINAILDQY